MPSPLSWVDPLGLTSCKLAEAIEEAGISRPANSEAHHIVPERAQSAGPARDILNKHGIDINGADNGVFLPNRHNTDDLPGIEHNGRHPDDHIDDTNERIKRADRKGGKFQIITELRVMRNILLKANRNTSWSNVLK
ncbi:AHH domain-containing protein [Hafnia alvei]|uniref:AHH domain-containing protein n=1 Tax=Hafnia alvei TaxID=569 RepID=UPI0020C77975|nr:AHH domain-containing protein [Hafnia alvei]